MISSRREHLWSWDFGRPRRINEFIHEGSTQPILCAIMNMFGETWTPDEILPGFILDVDRSYFA
ncbi:12875_t:CDS:1, partial [Ambispora gerdemannii]